MNTPPSDTSLRRAQASTTRLWLVLSLVANVFLGIFLYVAMTPLREPAPPVLPPEAEQTVKTNVVVRHETFSWAEVESTNYAAFVKNLRGIGCPERTIRDIILSEIDRLYLRRRLEEVTYPNYQWWLSDPDPAVVQTAHAKLEELESERRDLLNSLLGQGWDKPDNVAIAAAGGITLTGPILGDMSSALKEQVYGIAARAQRKIEAYQTAQREQNKPDDPMEMVRLRNEPLAKLSALLSPDQFEEYCLRYSPSAQQLREQLRSIQLTPDLFREIFDAVHSLNGGPGFYYDGTDSQLLAEKGLLHSQCDAVIKSILGEDLYSTYRMNADPLFQSSKAMVEQLGVPEKSVTAVYQINRATQAELDRIRNDDSMTADEKVEAISQTQVEQQQTLQEILGPEAYGRWLQTHTGFQ